MRKNRIPESLLTEEQLKKKEYNRRYREKKKKKESAEKVTVLYPGEHMSSAEKKDIEEKIEKLHAKITHISENQSTIISQSIEKLLTNKRSSEKVAVVGEKERKQSCEQPRKYLLFFWTLILLFYFFVSKDTFKFNLSWAGDGYQAILATLMWDGSIALLGFFAFQNGILSQAVRRLCLTTAICLVIGNIAAVTGQKYKASVSYTAESTEIIEAKEAVSMAKAEYNDWKNKYDNMYNGGTHSTKAEEFYGPDLEESRKMLKEKEHYLTELKKSYKSSDQSRADFYQFLTRCIFYSGFWGMIFLLKFVMSKVREASFPLNALVAE